MFQTIRFLTEYEIPHRTHGQKTTRGWVQVEQCPYCFGDNYYLGINLNQEFFHCWFCGASGKIEYLIQKLLKTSYSGARKIVGEFGGGLILDQTQPEIRASEVVIEGKTSLREIHVNYLKGRNFDVIELERKYKIFANYTLGRFPYRVVIPVYDNGVLVSATARDVTGQQQERYLSLKNEESVVPIKECVYNIDSVRGENVLIVEGPFDVWRIGGATVSLFGTDFKTTQVMRIVSKCVKNAFILFDKEKKAQEMAGKLAACLSSFVEHVEVLTIEEKDPAMLSKKDASDIKKDLKI